MSHYGAQLFDAFATGWTGPFTGERGGTYWLSPTGKPSYDEPGEGETEPKDDVIGKGSTGEVRRIGDEVHKSAVLSNGQKSPEGEVYSQLAGIDGIAPGRVDGDKIITPFYKNVVSTDAIPEKQRNSIAPIVDKNKARINQAVSELTAIGKSYNDPLQFGLNANKKMDLLDFSNVNDTGIDEARRDNIGHLKTFYTQFGMQKEAARLGIVNDVLDGLDLDDDTADWADPKVLPHLPKLKSQLGGKKPKYAYYATNGRHIGIGGIGQTEPIDGMKAIVSHRPLTDAEMSQWEITPVLHYTGTRKHSERFQSYANWQGPFEGERGGRYWLSPSGERSYEGPQGTNKPDARKELNDLAQAARDPKQVPHVANAIGQRLPGLAAGIARASGNREADSRRAGAVWADSAAGVDPATSKEMAGRLSSIASDTNPSSAGGKVKQLASWLASLPVKAFTSVFKAIGSYAGNLLKSGLRVAGAVGLHLGAIALGAGIIAASTLLPAIVPGGVALLAAFPIGYGVKRLITGAGRKAGNLLDPQQKPYSERLTRFTEPLPTDQVALAGPDGKRVAELLRDAKHKGMLVLHYLARRATKRLLGKKNPGRAQSFFDEDELQVLADSLAAVTATANLLGRSRIRERAEQAELIEQGVREFGENDLFVAFADPPPPLQPDNAINYFQRLVPTLAIPAGFASRTAASAFTIAGATDLTMLAAIKNVIASSLASGDTTGRVADIQDILEQAGLSTRNPQRAESIFRTETMRAYNQGSQEELDDPLMQEAFPAWEYASIVDGRQRPTHGARNGKLYPSAVTFEEVRGTDAADEINCRCTFIAISKYALRDRLAAGEKVETDW